MDTKQWRNSEILDEIIYRPLASIVVDFLKGSRITPDHISVAAASIGILAGVAIGYGAMVPGLLFVGASFCILHSILDCADGQLARLRGGGSRFGAVIDGLCDYIAAIAIHLGIFFFLLKSQAVFFNNTFSTFQIFLLVLVAGVSMGLRCVLLDKYKARIQYLINPNQPRNNDTEKILQELKECTKYSLDYIFVLIYYFYTKGQMSLVPKKTKQINLDKEYHHFRCWCWAGPTSHIALIAIFSMSAFWFPTAFYWYLLVSIVPLNIYMLAVEFKYR